MKKGLMLLAAIMLAMGLLVSCGESGGDDVESALQGTWLDNPTTMDNTIKAYMIMTADTFEMDIYVLAALPLPANLEDGSAKGDLEADNGKFTTTTKFEIDTGAWVAVNPPTVDNSTYVLNGNTLIITADWDGAGPNPASPETFIRQ